MSDYRSRFVALTSSVVIGRWARVVFIDDSTLRTDKTMGHKDYLRASGILFTFVALVHLIRIFNGWSFSIGDMMIPMWASWLGVIIPGALAFWSFNLKGAE